MCNTFPGAPYPRHQPTGAPALTLRLHDNRIDENARIARAVEGDEAEREWLVRHFTPVVYRFTRRMMGNDQDASDATQDTMLKVLRNLHRYDDRWKFTTWILGIARNTCIDEFRKRKRRSDREAPDISDPGPSPLELTTRQLRAERLHQALEEIPPLYREVLVLYHFEHLKYQEIADLLEIPIGTVMNRIFRARRKLRDAYDTIEATPAAREARP